MPASLLPGASEAGLRALTEFVIVQALAGANMVRRINTEYIAPLNEVLPPSRLGELGDAPKVQCITCHQGVVRPLYGT